jgi:predicted negative regulator of RcsB-dependent stress response
LALIHFQKKELKETEKTINTLIAYNYSTNDWNTKAMILMSDVYVDKNEINNAEVILQSVIDNADKPEYTDMANQKLQVIKDNQQAKIETEKKQEQMQIEFQNKGKDLQLESQPKIEKADSVKTNIIQPK